jgi:hypothetical protein
MKRALAVLPALVAFILLVPSQAQAASIFAVDCKSSHRSLDDPIVAPGMPGAAHNHEFTGAWSTDAFSTFGSLQRSGTTCLTGAAEREDATADKSGYWAPTLFQNGERVPLQSMSIYVSAGANNNADQLRQLRRWPDGLRFIMDMRVGTSGGVAGWNCGGNFLPQVPSQDTPPDCTAVGGKIQAHVASPACWDGVNLDSPDHRSHMAYNPEGRSGCPESHPVIVPEMVIKHNYDHRGAGGGFTIAGGHGAEDVSPSKFHADFFNAWDADKLNQLIDFCIKQGGAQSNTRPCLHPNVSEAENTERTSWITNPNSPNATQPPDEPAPEPQPQPERRAVWSHGKVMLNGIDQQVAIPDVLGSSTAYSLRTTYTGAGIAGGDSQLMMVGNTSGDHARIYVNGTKVKAYLVVGGVVAALPSARYTANQAHDFVLVRDGSTVRFYMDGVLVGTDASFAGSPHDLGPGALGAYREGDGFYSRAPGTYDKARVYPYALTPEEIAAP